MRIYWPPRAEEVAAADAAPWDGPLNGWLPPRSYGWLVRANRFSLVFHGVAAATALVATPLIGGLSGIRRTELYALDGVLAVLTVMIALQPYFMPPARGRRLAPLIIVSGLLVQAPLVSLYIAAAGGGGDAFVIFYAEAPILAFYWLRPLAALAVVVCGPIEYAVVLATTVTGRTDAVAKWLIMTSVVFATGAIVGYIAARLEQATEQAQAAGRELEEVNAHLEERVTSQVSEIEGLNRLRRFLAPSVADAIAGQNHEELLAPHRRAIAVLFCDLRGFTAFTNANEPEVVMAVLGEYLEAMGRILDGHGVTVAQFTGDGVMAFVGDPIPIENPAEVAVATARELQAVFNPISQRWLRQGHALGLGCSVAYGDALLGVVGTGGRSDYAPMGSVVNLAARLCAKALAGQVLIDHATHVATRSGTPSVHMGTLELKGFGPGVPAYAVAF